ncbi:hypothetical protein LIER_33044 [Lithospermum erythrorhizon]|uniref:Uncharacterized protein n=1 Tax=Lithospermum erythrorhizon TaxID=34254 RepID=A0AAV3S1A7_LITER
MVKTRRGLNTSGKATKRKKKGVGLSDDACMEVEALILNQEAQKMKGKELTVKGKKSKGLGSTKFDVNNNYLPWVDYMNVCELDNPRPSGTNLDDDVGGKLDDDVGGKDLMMKLELSRMLLEKRTYVNPFVEDTTDHVTAKSSDKEEAEETVPEEVRPFVVQPNTDDEWLPEHEPQGNNANDEAQESEEENISFVITKRRKTTSKLRLNRNRTRVGNKRVPKNVVAVSTANVELNSEEEQAKWRFVVNRRVAAEKMLSEVTKKNPNIVGILKGAGVMPTVQAVGSSYPKLVKEFVCNMNEDIVDPVRI